MTKWDDEKEASTLMECFSGATAVISCLGNRQPGFFERELKKGWVSHVGNQLVVKAMEKHAVSRVVVMSSVGVAEGTLLYR